MALDRAIWQKAITHYQAWNQARFREKVRQAGQKSLTEKWGEYLALMEFGLHLKPQPTRHEQRRKMEHWAQYYRLVREFERKRGEREQSARRGVA